jgi:3D (Asp-Asp-Asp) domain-containing protein
MFIRKNIAGFRRDGVTDRRGSISDVRIGGIATAALAATALAACGDAREHAPDASPGVDSHVADAAPPGATRGSFKLTYYWVTAEDDFTAAADTQLFDSSCALLDTVPAAFADSLDTEGTGRLVDGRVINTTGPCNCGRSPCYDPVDTQHPWGTGVQNRALIPFRTIAVDPKVIPYGTPLYIEELDGVVMPGDSPWGGFVHDGCVIAGDTGGAIIGTHIDFFSGLKSGYTALDAKLALKTVTIHDGGARCPAL